MVARSIFWKVALVIGIALLFVAFILGWIGFGVPDWQQLRRFNNSPVEFFGLWAYCQRQGGTTGTVCKRWTTARDQLFNGSRPDFIRVSDGLFTTGMIVLTLGLISAILAVILPFLAYLAAILGFIAFVFLIIGLPIFARRADNFSRARGDVFFGKRYGFWFMVPTIVLQFLAFLLFAAAGALYQLFGFGNLATVVPAGIIGGRRRLGPANILTGPPAFGPRPLPFGFPRRDLPPIYDLGYGMRVLPQFGIGPESRSLPLANGILPPLLSEYLSERSSRRHYRSDERLFTESSLPQPSIVRAVTIAPVPNVTPAYTRIYQVGTPIAAPIINLTGETIVGPIRQIS